MAWVPKSDLFHVNYAFASWALLLTAVGIFAGLVLAPWFRVRREALEAKGGRVWRHAPAHILMHWLNAAGFLLATLTGAVMLKWIRFDMDKVLLYTLHYIGAGAVLIGFFATVANAWSRGTSTRHRLIPTGRQIRTALVELLAYAGLVGNRGILGFPAVQWPAGLRRALEKAVGYQPEAAGKYLAAEEVLSYPLWALVALAIVSTGILKAVRYGYPLPGGLIKWMTIIHDWAAIGTVVMLAVHVGALVLVRTNWPLFGSMFTARVRAQYVQERHGEWHAALVAGTPAVRKETAATAEKATPSGRR